MYDVPSQKASPLASSSVILVEVPMSNPVPLIVNLLPPAMGPNAGSTLLTVGNTTMNRACSGYARAIHDRNFHSAATTSSS